MSECKYCHNQRLLQDMPNMVDGYCLWCYAEGLGSDKIVLKQKNEDLQEKLKFWEEAVKEAREDMKDIEAENKQLKIDNNKLRGIMPAIVMTGHC